MNDIAVQSHPTDSSIMYENPRKQPRASARTDPHQGTLVNLIYLLNKNGPLEPAEPRRFSQLHSNFLGKLAEARLLKIVNISSSRCE